MIRTLIFSLFVFPITAQNEVTVTINKVFLEQFVDYWKAADSHGLASLWHEDGDWMSVVGSRKVFKGLDQIQSVWEVGLQGRDTEEQRKIEVDIDTTAILGPDLAQVDLVLTFGHPQSGVLKEAMIAILRKDKQGWKIQHCRVARISFTPGSN